MFQSTAALVKAVLNEATADDDRDRPYLPESSQDRYRELIAIYARLKNLPDFLHIPRCRPATRLKKVTWDSYDVDDDPESSDNDDQIGNDDIRSLQIALQNLVSSETMMASGLNPVAGPLQFLRDDFVAPAELDRDPDLTRMLHEARLRTSRRQYCDAVVQIQNVLRYLDQQDGLAANPPPSEDGVAPPEPILSKRQRINARIYVLLYDHRVRSLLKEDDLALVAAWKARELMNAILVEEYNTVNTAHPVNSLIHSAIGTSAYYCGWMDIALKCHYAALEMRMQFVDAVTGESSIPDQVTALNNVAACLGNRSRPDEAFVLLSVAFDIGRKILPISHPVMDVLVGNLERIRNRAKHLHLPSGDTMVKPTPNTFLVAMKAWEMPNLVSGKKGKKGGKKGKKKKK